MPGARAARGTSKPAPGITGYTVLHRFKNGPRDGAEPAAGLTTDGYPDYTLYGTTYAGGKYSAGTAFSMTTSGTETLLHSFGKGNDGRDPGASLLYPCETFGRPNTLYGTTEYGGTGPYGNQSGTVFSITTSGTETVLHNFQGWEGSDGDLPMAGLVAVLYSNGVTTLYGTTQQGSTAPPSGQYNDGTVFGVNTDGSNYQVLWSFGSVLPPLQDGDEPTAPLIAVGCDLLCGPNLIGTTQYGGENEYYNYSSGTVFQVSAGGGPDTISYSFRDNGIDGVFPTGIVSGNGATGYSTLYMTTQGGGQYYRGTVVAVSGNSDKVLHSFGNGADGATPEGGVIDVNGTLYGTTQGGGRYGFGTVFSVTLAGKERVLYSFKGGKDGADPEGGLLYINGTLYGTTYAGGSTRNCSVCGTVFALTP